VPRPITQQNLGAWLLRCNPKHEPELPELVAAGGHRIKRWCVADNYRSRMMAAGDPIVFWVSGNGRLLVRGIWGIGHVVGAGGFRTLSADHEATSRSVSKPSERPKVDVDIPLLSEGISDRLLRASGITDLEVQLQPQGSNPSWISVEQLAQLARSLPGLFAPPGREHAGRPRSVPVPRTGGESGQT